MKEEISRVIKTREKKMTGISTPPKWWHGDSARPNILAPRHNHYGILTIETPQGHHISLRQVWKEGELAGKLRSEPAYQLHATRKGFNATIILHWTDVYGLFCPHRISHEAARNADWYDAYAIEADLVLSKLIARRGQYVTIGPIDTNSDWPNKLLLHLFLDSDVTAACHRQLGIT